MIIVFEWIEHTEYDIKCVLVGSGESNGLNSDWLITVNKLLIKIT